MTCSEPYFDRCFAILVTVNDGSVGATAEEREKCTTSPTFFTGLPCGPVGPADCVASGVDGAADDASVVTVTVTVGGALATAASPFPEQPAESAAAVATAQSSNDELVLIKELPVDQHYDATAPKAFFSIAAHKSP